MTDCRKIHLGIVIDTCGPFYIGGYETRAWELAQRLAIRNYVTIFTACDQKTKIAGVNFVPIRPRLDTFNSNGFRSRKQALLFSLAVLKLAVTSREQVDIVDCNATPFLHIIPAWLFARTRSAHFVLTAHEALGDQIKSYLAVYPSRGSGGFLLLMKALYWLTMRSSKTVIATSSVAAKGLQKEGVRRVKTVVGGVAKLGEAKVMYGGRLVFIGRLVPNKRIDILLDAFAEALHLKYVTSLFIIGSGPQSESLQRQVEVLGINKHVSFLGSLSEDEKLNVLKNYSDVFISASWREGVSIATLEAMAQGCVPIIASKPDKGSNGCLEYIKNNINGIVTTGNLDSMVSAAYTLNNIGDMLFQEMSKSAISIAKEYTWDAASEQTENVYKSLIGPI